MGRISAAAVRHYPHLFAGMFVALSLGAGLTGLTARAILAAIAVHPGPAGQSLTLRAGNGSPGTVTSSPQDMSALISILGLGATVTALVTIMVVAGAAALSISLRRRDIGLLRMAGAGKGAVRRMILAEALVVAVPAVIAGSGIAVAATPVAFTRLNATGLAPVAIVPGPPGPPLLIGAGAGLFIAVLGALAASGTATRTRPHAALQEATLDSGGLTAVRTVLGIVFLAAGTVMVGVTFGMRSDTATPVAIFGTVFLAVGAIALAPAFVPPLLRLGLLPLQAVDPVAGWLAAASAGTARRRTSSLVAPVLGVLAVVGIFATVLATSSAGARQDQLNRDAAQFQVTAAHGLTAAELRAIRAVPGVAVVTAPVPGQVALAGQFDVSTENAEAVNLAALARTTRFTVAQGRLAPLASGQVAISEEYASWEGWHAGSRISYAVFGGSRKSSRIRIAAVAAVIDAGQALPPLILPEGSIVAQPQAAQVRLSADASVPEVTARVAARLAGNGVTITPSSTAISAQQEQQAHVNWTGLLILAAPASVYAIIGIASTIVMAASRRRPEIAVLRRLGLTRPQVLRLAAWEALGTTLTGCVLAGALVSFGLAAFRVSVPVYGGEAPLGIPWPLLLTVVGGCLAANLIVSLLTTARLLGNRLTAE